MTWYEFKGCALILLSICSIIVGVVAVIIGLTKLLANDPGVAADNGVVTLVSAGASGGLYRFTDVDAGVTCWESGTGLSCLRNP